jgi:hypothetical protein
MPRLRDGSATGNQRRFRSEMDWLVAITGAFFLASQRALQKQETIAQTAIVSPRFLRIVSN